MSEQAKTDANIPQQQQQQQCRWQMKEAPPRHANSGSVTSGCISQGQNVGVGDESARGGEAGQGRAAEEEASRWLAPMTKLHGLSRSQQARGQKQWRGVG